MSNFRKKFDHKIKATRGRRERADAAPRLAETVPELVSLKLVIHETAGDAEIPGSRRTRPVVIEHAPAWFELPCIDPGCHDGGHDVTPGVMKQLGNGAEKFEGSHECQGKVDGEPCGRVLHFDAAASYAAKPARAGA